jgi:solute carrier family 5 (sodium-coupled monocarboxylate transporter), member 8/12
VLVGSVIVMAVIVLRFFNGDVSSIWRVAAEAGHTKMFTWSYNFWEPDFWLDMTVLGIVLGLFVSQVGAYGSDQVLVQRYIAAGSERMMAQSLYFSAILQIPVMTLLYLLGLGFFAYYHSPGNESLLNSLEELVTKTKDPNLVLPHFVRNVLPSGLAGLTFAGLFAATMSVFSSGLNSLSTVTCIDFLQRLNTERQTHDGKSNPITVTNARWITLVWGIVITVAAVAVYFAHMGSLLLTAVAIIGFFSGPLLGMFLLGMFSLRANSQIAVGSAIVGFIVALLLWNKVSVIWYAVIGCVPTLLFGFVTSFLIPSDPSQRTYEMTIWGRNTLPENV